MDPASSEPTRQLAEEALEELLDEPDLSESIQNRLFSAPLPADAVWVRDHPSVVIDACPRISSIKRAVVGAREAIRRVRLAWDSLPPGLFPAPHDRFMFESALIEAGAFQLLAKATAGPDDQFGKGNAQVSLLADNRFRAFPNFRSILVEWATKIPSHSRLKQQSVPHGSDEEGLSGSRKRIQRAPVHEAFQNVVVQKESILKQLGKRDFGRVDKFVDELVRHQLGGGQAELAAKSLCDLAKRAKDLGFLAYQLAWSRRAVEINPADPFVHSQFADALLSQGDLPSALEGYEATVRDFPHHAAARNGKAEVLKAMGRLPEALEVYEATVRDFPENIVARSGTAEMLKAMGRLPEALEAYEATVRDFPENSVARSGMAEVLKAMGRLPEALEAYEVTVRDFPQDVVTRNGKAEVLKAMGRLPEALEAYEATVRDFPQDVVARSGKAEVLKALGRLPEALEAYEATVRDFPHAIVARTGKATLLVSLGRYAEALAMAPAEKPQTRDQWIWLHIRAAIELKQGRYALADDLFSTGTACPWAEVKSRFIASRALLRIRTKRLNEANEMIRSEQSLESKVIRIDIYRRMNRIGEARAVLREIRGCHVAQIDEISRDLERNMTAHKRTVSDDEFLEREFALLLAA